MSATEPVPSIAEKVRFWQEQDQINQALIPRVVKLHDTVAEIARQMEGTPTLLAAMESRLRRQTHEEKEKLEQRASQLEQLAEQQADSLSILRKEASDEWISLRRDVERAGFNAADLARRIDEHSLRIETLQKSLIDELAQLREELHTLAAAQETSLAIRPPAPSELAGSRPPNIVGLGVSLVALVLAVLALMVHGRG